MAGQALPDGGVPLAPQGPRQSQAKAAEQPPDAVLDIPETRQQGGARQEKGTLFPRIHGLHMDGAKPPVRNSWAMPRASLRSVLMVIAERA